MRGINMESFHFFKFYLRYIINFVDANDINDF